MLRRLGLQREVYDYREKFMITEKFRIFDKLRITDKFIFMVYTNLGVRRC